LLRSLNDSLTVRLYGALVIFSAPSIWGLSRTKLLDMTTFDIKKTIRGTTPSIPFEKIATDVLGRRYELSLVVCGDTLAQKMNKKYRNKSYSPNVLSFPIEKKSGEIFLNVRSAEREARKYNVPLRSRMALLFVHGLFHLKGLSHGARMENAEQRILTKFKLAK